MPKTFLTGKCEERGWRRYLWRLLAAAADGVCRASRREKGNAMTRTPVLHKLTGQEEWRRDVADPTRAIGLAIAVGIAYFLAARLSVCPGRS